MHKKFRLDSKGKLMNQSMNLIMNVSEKRRGQNYVSGSIKNLDKGNAERIAEYIQKAVDADKRWSRLIQS